MGHEGVSRNKLHFVPRSRASLPENRSFELLIRGSLFELENGTIVRLSRLFVTSAPSPGRCLTKKTADLSVGLKSR